MDKQRPQIFFSYCWDNKDEYNFLKYLKKTIERKAHNSINVFLDKESTKPGDKYEEHERKINTAELTIVFFTPEYKKILKKDTEKRRLKKEYALIVEQLSDRSYSIFPVLFKGTVETSIPREFSDKHCHHLMDISYEKKSGIPVIIRKDKRKFNDFVSDIINRANVNFDKRLYEWSNEDEEINKLLHNTKSKEDFPEECLIRIAAYDDIFKQYVYFIIGRKGTGKSTLLDTIKRIDKERYSQKYKTLTPIKADDINIEFVYDILIRTYKDRTILLESFLLELYWELFIILQCIYNIALEEEKQIIQATDPRKRTFKKVTNLLKKILGNIKNISDETARKGISNLATELIINQLNEALNHADKNLILTSYKANVNTNSILNSLLKKNWRPFINALNQCEKRILISLDGFDVTSDDFRIETIRMEKTCYSEYENRSNFEKMYYRSLLTTVDKFKDQKSGNETDVFRKLIDFCIVLPQDRIDQIRDVDRDRAKRRYSYLSWDAYELLEMLALRLEHVYQIKQPMGMNPKERILSIMKQKLYNIPLFVSVNVKGTYHSFDLLNYILRLSFWRPREIIFHFAKLINVHKNNENLKKPLSDHLVKTTLVGSTKKIIEDELIKEYEHVFYNLRDILKIFNHSKLIWETKQFLDLIEKKQFKCVFKEGCDTIDGKLKLLYHLGIIGLYYDKEEAKKLSYGYHVCFIFNEGLDAIDHFIETANYSNTRTKIIINPIFTNYLSLDMNTDELIENYDWSYIEENHFRKVIIRRA